MELYAYAFWSYGSQTSESEVTQHLITQTSLRMRSKCIFRVCKDGRLEEVTPEDHVPLPRNLTGFQPSRVSNQYFFSPALQEAEKRKICLYPDVIALKTTKLMHEWATPDRRTRPFHLGIDEHGELIFPTRTEFPFYELTNKPEPLTYCHCSYCLNMR